MSVSGDKTVSLLIPCYKCGDTVGMVLDSALEQTQPFDELVCYVDGCPHNTFDVLKKYKKEKYPNLIIIGSKTNIGIAAARNQLLHYAKSKFVSYQDSDDPLHPQFLEKLKPKLEAGSATIAFFIQQEKSKKRIIQGSKLYTERHPIIYLVNNFNHLNSVIFCSRKLRQISGFCEELSMYEDKEVLLRFVLLGGRVQLVQEVLAYWIKRPGSLLHSTGWEKHNYNFLLMLKNLAPLFDIQNIEVKSVWADYVKHKMRMIYLQSQCSKYISEIAQHASPPEKKWHQYLIILIGHINYLRCLRLYAKFRKSLT